MKNVWMKNKQSVIGNIYREIVKDLVLSASLKELDKLSSKWFASNILARISLAYKAINIWLRQGA